MNLFKILYLELVIRKFCIINDLYSEILRCLLKTEFLQDQNLNKFCSDFCANAIAYFRCLWIFGEDLSERKTCMLKFKVYVNLSFKIYSICSGSHSDANANQNIAKNLHVNQSIK